MTEDTKPVERESELLNACEHFLSIWPDPGPFALKEFVKLHRQASADAALERAADEVDSKLDLILDVLLKDSANKAGIKKAVRDAIRALKGRE